MDDQFEIPWQARLRNVVDLHLVSTQEVNQPRIVGRNVGAVGLSAISKAFNFGVSNKLGAENAACGDLVLEVGVDEFADAGVVVGTLVVAEHINEKHGQHHHAENDQQVFLLELHDDFSLRLSPRQSLGRLLGDAWLVSA